MRVSPLEVQSGIRIKNCLDTMPGSQRAVDSDGAGELEAFCTEILTELRDLHVESSRREKAVEQTSEMRDYRLRQKNLWKTDKAMAWIESSSSQLLWIDGNSVLRWSVCSMSFTAPLLVLGESIHETVLVLRHHCGDHTSHQAKNYRHLIQALLYQIFEKHPAVFNRRKTSLTREGASNVSVLWDIFVTCLEDVDADCTFIVIDNIDMLGTASSIDRDDGSIVIHKLNVLVEDQTKLVKVLLTASLARDHTSSSAGRAALTMPRRRESLNILQDGLALVPYKLIEIQQGRCKAISFSEITMLYVPNTTVYTMEDGELQAFIVAELSGMESRSFEVYDPLQLRVWSIDHDGTNITRRVQYLTVPQYSGQRAIKSLRYIPAGYMPNESEQRKQLVARGRLWWKYSSGVHHVLTGIDKLEVCKKFPTSLRTT